MLPARQPGRPARARPQKTRQSSQSLVSLWRSKCAMLPFTAIGTSKACRSTLDRRRWVPHLLPLPLGARRPASGGPRAAARRGGWRSAGGLGLQRQAAATAWCQCLRRVEAAQLSRTNFRKGFGATWLRDGAATSPAPTPFSSSSASDTPCLQTPGSVYQSTHIGSGLCRLSLLLPYKTVLRLRSQAERRHECASRTKQVINQSRPRTSYIKMRAFAVCLAALWLAERGAAAKKQQVPFGSAPPPGAPGFVTPGVSDLRVCGCATPCRRSRR